RDATLTAVVADDGVGVDDSARRGGLDNLRARAERRRGDFVVARGTLGGTRLTWSVPSKMPPIDA
ncbi:MAG: hypothetical protein WBP59_16825, partial [Ilumatobacteraceae bacterium]